MASSDVPERAWSASNLLQSFSDAAVQPAKLGKLVEDLQTVLVSPSKQDRMQHSEGGDAVAFTWTRPAQMVVSESSEPHFQNGLGSPASSSSPLHSFATKHSASTLSALSAAAASLKDKTHQVAQQQKRALSIFQQKGGLVSWLHGEMEDHEAVDPCLSTTPTSPTTPRAFIESAAFDLSPPPSPRSSIDIPLMKQPAVEKGVGRRRSMPTMASASLFDTFIDKVAGVTTPPPSSVSPQGHSRVRLGPAIATAKSPPSPFEDFANESSIPHQKTSLTQETIRQRAATTELPCRPTVNADPGEDEVIPPALLKARSAASLRSQPETRFSLDSVLSDEWSCTCLWAHVYSSVDRHDKQHHSRLSFLIETTFGITPLYRKVAGADNTCSEKHEDLKKLVVRLERLHSRFLTRNGTTSFATSGVPVSSPAAIHAKNQLALVVHSLTDQNVPDSEFVQNVQVEKALSALLQLAREVEREFRVLGTRSYITFADTALYRDFVSPGSNPRNFVALLRAARIPFYQQPNTIVEAISLSSLVTEEEATNTIFSRAGCRVFMVAVQPGGSINFTEIFPGNSTESIENPAVIQQTIESFLNPSANAHPAASKPLAFNFIAGTGNNTYYGAVMWLPVGNKVLGSESIPSGLCIVSKSPLVNSLRYFLSSLWKCTEDKTEVNDLPISLLRSTQEMGKYFNAHISEASKDRQTGDLLPAIDFKLGDLFDCLSLSNILRLFAFILLEKKIVLVASSYTILFSVSEALRVLIHPLVWSHVYVPVLPLALKDCLQCPTPFIFGLHDSYVRHSEMPRPSNDLVVVNLDRDSLTGGGDIFLPPVRHSMLRAELFRVCKPHLSSRDSVDNFATDNKTTDESFCTAIRRVFCNHLLEILASLEPCINRFELDGQCISVVDNAQSSQWPADTTPFCSAILHTQAVSTYVALSRINERGSVERVLV